VSSRLSRFETPLTAVLVLAIAVSALVTEPGSGEMTLCVPAGDGNVAAPRFSALKDRVSRAMGRPLRLHLRGGAPGDECDLAVVSVHELQGVEGSWGLEPVAVVEGAQRAVVIAGRDGPREMSGVSVGTMLFTAPQSLNGCWIQLESLRRNGVSTPARMDELRFVPAPGRPERVVFEVALGGALVGAVPGDVLEGMLGDGRIVDGEVRVINIASGVPELLLCRRRGGAPPVERLIREGFRPVADHDLERIAALFRMAGSMGWE
jgi:hypothetical protein